jgi:hypothetical protein
MLITGKITGKINNQRLEDLDLYSYVLTHSSDSRNFVAIGKVPVNLGGSFQILINLITPINWLFAGKNGFDTEIKLSNGFASTGTTKLNMDNKNPANITHLPSALKVASLPESPRLLSLMNSRDSPIPCESDRNSWD